MGGSLHEGKIGFPHLHVSTAYSAHYGVDRPEQLVAQAAADGAWALACTDRDGLYGAVKHVAACIEHGIAPILGVDLALLEGTGASGVPAGSKAAAASGAAASGATVVGRVVVLARGSAEGYSALVRLVSLAHRRGTEPHGIVGVSRADIGRAAVDPEGAVRLSVLLGPDSDVGHAAYRRRYAVMRRRLKSWQAAVGTDALFVELVSHMSRPGQRCSHAHALRMWKAARESGVAAVLTNAVRYASPDGAATADVVDAVRLMTPLGSTASAEGSSAAARKSGAAAGTAASASRGESPQVNGQGWLKPGAHMYQVASELASVAGLGAQGAEHLLRSTQLCASLSVLDPVEHMGWGTPVVPEAHVIGIKNSPMRELRKRCLDSLERLFAPGGEAVLHHSAGRAERMRQRALDVLEHELGIIEDLGFASYFLTVAAATDIIHGMGVRAAARGSGASSLVVYLLGVSHVNPLEHDLIFERFLSRERASLPDIDVDVESAQRHAVYKELFKRFGEDRTTLMSMQNAYRARGAVRDAGYALGMESEDIDRAAKSLWRLNAANVRDAVGKMPELAPLAQRLEAERRSGNNRWDLLVDLTERLDRLPRHISMHPCGVILSDSSLLDRTPVQPSGMGLAMSQFDKHDMDHMGLIKFDVLGVRMQSAIAYTLEEIKRIHGDARSVYAAGQHDRASLKGWYQQPGSRDQQVRETPEGGGAPDALGISIPDTVPDSPAAFMNEAGDDIPWISPDGLINLDRIPFDDETTFEMIRTTNTLGIFQIESPGQRELIGKLAPIELNDLIIDISLFRPGPMQSDMVTPFLEQRHGFRHTEVPHPDLAPILKETHGVVVFHEQVLRIIDTMTGCGLARADVYRRWIGNPEKEPIFEKAFRREALAKGYKVDVIDKVWEILAAFGSFGFCKAHGAAFAIPTYQSAWLKTHHPEAFMAALFEHDPGMYPQRLLIAEARRLGIPLLPLDVNTSSTSFKVERIPEQDQVQHAQTQREPVPGIQARGDLGIRMSWSLVGGLTSAEAQRLSANAPYTSIADVRSRARISKSSMVRLAQLGALDRFLIPGRGSRADLIHHLDAQRNTPQRTRRDHPIPGQGALDLGVDIETASLTPVFPDPTPEQNIRTELDLTAADISGHVMNTHYPYLDAVGATPSNRLLELRSGTRVLVAGVRVATQTPPMRSGERVVFISLDDGHGCVDIAFFAQAQEEAGPLVFSSRLMLVEGTTRRTGPRAVSVQAVRAWDLQEPITAETPSERIPPQPGYLNNTSLYNTSHRSDPKHSTTSNHLTGANYTQRSYDASRTSVS